MARRNYCGPKVLFTVSRVFVVNAIYSPQKFCVVLKCSLQSIAYLLLMQFVAPRNFCAPLFLLLVAIRVLGSYGSQTLLRPFSLARSIQIKGVLFRVVEGLFLLGKI